MWITGIKRLHGFAVQKAHVDGIQPLLLPVYLISSSNTIKYVKLGHFKDNGTAIGKLFI